MNRHPGGAENTRRLTELAKLPEGTAVLDTVKKKLASASNEIDNAFTRHRAMGRKLRDVEAVETADAFEPALPESSDEE